MRILKHEELINATCCTKEAADRFLPGINKAISIYEISKSTPRLAAFLAQTSYESIRFSRMAENLNYSKEGLLRVWPTRFNGYSAVSYAGQPEAIANYVYAKRGGNGPEYSGDGWKYRGRGLIQLTFKGNYAVCGAALRMNLVDDPDLVLVPETAVMVAGWYWDTNKCNAMMDGMRFDATSIAINKYDKDSFKRRRSAYVRALQVLNGVA